MGEDLSGWKGCAAPEVPVIEGRHVNIAPFGGFDEGMRLWEALGGSAANDLLRYFPNPDYESGEEFANWLVCVQGDMRTAVFSDPGTGRPLGMGSYMRIDAKNGVVEIGSIVHGPAMARSPASTEAQYLLAAQVFDVLGYRRYEWKCHNENEASKRAARRLGFVFEGVFRQHMISKGKNRDTAWFSMIDGEWPRSRAAFRLWLDPDNFDENGRQKRRLEDFREV